MGLEKPIHAMAGSLVGVNTSQPVFHLTFDDGPHPDVTPRVLDVLSEHQVTATFFVLTERAQQHPELIDRLKRQGHEIALHTRTHPRLTETPLAQMIDEIRHARRDLEEVTKTKVRWFRPPYGAQNLRSLAVVRASGMQTVLWSVDSWDWKGLTAENPLERRAERLTPGGILLMHDTPADESGDDAAKGLIAKDELTALYLAELAKRGLEAVSLDDLLAAGTPTRRAKFSRG
ncbi:MAG: polysaccharide deacetylase family protein [Acidimicrobiia bacterium]|jgi:peptidoglycan/xylan/chitin deacetylase (PgdA/CDA1 family)